MLEGGVLKLRHGFDGKNWKIVNQVKLLRNGENLSNQKKKPSSNFPIPKITLKVNWAK
jgi:hypothetical protein